ncbi:MAG: BrnA antitoxin family protein [Paracoccaceae bacterium]
MKDTKTASLEELRKMKERGALEATREDAPEIDMPDGFWDDAEVSRPVTKKAVSLRVDPDILEFFKDQGNGHLTRMHAVLRSYVDAQKKRRHTSS